MIIMGKEPEPEPKMTIADLVNVISDVGTPEDLQPSTDIELANKIVDSLFDQTNINMITSLTKREFTGVIKLELLNDIIYGNNKNSILRKLLHTYKTLKVSEYRKGRIELIKAILGTKENAEQSGGVFRRYME